VHSVLASSSPALQCSWQWPVRQQEAVGTRGQWITSTLAACKSWGGRSTLPWSWRCLFPLLLLLPWFVSLLGDRMGTSGAFHSGDMGMWPARARPCVPSGSAALRSAACWETEVGAALAWPAAHPHPPATSISDGFVTRRWWPMRVIHSVVQISRCAGSRGNISPPTALYLFDVSTITPWDGH
jgi:hypothetical protein